MTMTITQDLGCAPGSMPGGLTRTRFFDGMFLTQADLENEQVYWRMKRRLTNRALGTGVVWGLRLAFDVKTRTYKLSPGYAIDCCGNDLVVECPIEISEADLLQRSQALLAQATIGNAISKEIRYYVVLQYVECPDSIRPVHRDACSPSGSSCEPSRMRETCRLLLVPDCSHMLCEPIRRFVTAIGTIRGDNAQAQVAPTWLRSFTELGGGATVGAAAFAGLYGFLRTADTYQASAQSRLVASQMMSSIASGMLGLELDSLDGTQTAALSTAASTLAEDLCKGMLYPGPRCLDEHHGVYLGGMRRLIARDQNGFDQWLCRREVLTGPLVNWWLCQFGIPGVDEIVNRLSQMICEIAATQEQNGSTISNAGDLMRLTGGVIAERRDVTPANFYASIARMLTTTDPGVGVVKLDTTAPNGKTMSMLVPASAAPSETTGSEVARLASAQLVADRNVTPLSRGPLRDLVGELGVRTAVSAVATNVDAATVKALGSMTVAQLLDAEPEAVLAKVAGAQPTDTQRTAVNALYGNAETFVRDATTAAAGAAKAGVTRAQLATTEIKAALKKVGVTAANVDAAAAAAAKR
jgi:hypothetical protein